MQSTWLVLMGRITIGAQECAPAKKKSTIDEASQKSHPPLCLTCLDCGSGCTCEASLAKCLSPAGLGAAHLEFLQNTLLLLL
jgi:hypothetical protein